MHGILRSYNLPSHLFSPFYGNSTGHCYSFSLSSSCFTAPKLRLPKCCWPASLACPSLQRGRSDRHCIWNDEGKDLSEQLLRIFHLPATSNNPSKLSLLQALIRALSIRHLSLLLLWLPTVKYPHTQSCCEGLTLVLLPTMDPTMRLMLPP